MARFRVCPQCGFHKALGRPRKLDDKIVFSLRQRHKWSYLRIAEHFSVTKSAIQSSLLRSHQGDKIRTAEKIRERRKSNRQIKKRPT